MSEPLKVECPKCLATKGRECWASTDCMVLKTRPPHAARVRADKVDNGHTLQCREPGPPKHRTPPAPSIEWKAFPTQDALNAFVLQRIVWRPCSETLVAVGPNGKVYRVAKVEKTKPVVREVLEHDGFNIEWTQFKEAEEME